MQRITTVSQWLSQRNIVLDEEFTEALWKLADEYKKTMTPDY